MNEHDDPFLKPAAVERLTGFQRKSSQLAWCKANGVRAWLNGKGEVIVPLSAINGTKVANDPEWRPDFKGIRGEG